MIFFNIFNYFGITSVYHYIHSSSFCSLYPVFFLFFALQHLFLLCTIRTYKTVFFFHIFKMSRVKSFFAPSSFSVFQCIIPIPELFHVSSLFRGISFFSVISFSSWHIKSTSYRILLNNDFILTYLFFNIFCVYKYKWYASSCYTS